MENPWIDIEKTLSLIAKNPNISDLHLSGGEYISYRLNWKIVKEESSGKISSEQMELFLKQLFYWNSQRFNKFLWDKESDFAYISKDKTIYRVNAYLKTGWIALVMRKIDKVAKKLEDIMLDSVSNSIKKNVLKKKKGLYLITWPTGNWKSTSLVAILEEINKNKSRILITIEDPIEYVFEPKKCIISQREIWKDTRSFANALKSAMRQDPDIVFVWEIRDKETAEAVLNLAETGHLVFSTLHTNSASHTIKKFISFFPPNTQWSIAERLSESLIGIQSQVLVKSMDDSARIWIFELMLNTQSIKTNIKKQDMNQINNIIKTSNTVWMITLKQYAETLIDKGIINPNDVEWILNKNSTKI